MGSELCINVVPHWNLLWVYLRVLCLLTMNFVRNTLFCTFFFFLPIRIVLAELINRSDTTLSSTGLHSAWQSVISLCVDHVLLFCICFEGKLLILISNGLCFCITFMFRSSVDLYQCSTMPWYLEIIGKPPSFKFPPAKNSRDPCPALVISYQVSICIWIMAVSGLLKNR